MSSKVINDSTTVIAISADKKYLEYATTLISQIRFTGNYDGDIILITPSNLNLPIHITTLFANDRKILHKKIDYKSYNLAISGKSHLSESAFARIFLEDVIPIKYVKCLYLDIDLYINSSLNELLNTRVEKTCRAMTYGGIPTWHRAFLDFSDYFNSGVLLINLVKWRGLNVKEKCIKLLDVYGSFEYADQDLLNIVLEKEWTELDYKFNYLFPLPKTRAKLAEPVIVHFAGEGKPWQRASGGRYGRKWRTLHSQNFPEFNLPASAYLKELILVAKEMFFPVLLKLRALFIK